MSIKLQHAVMREALRIASKRAVAPKIPEIFRTPAKSASRKFIANHPSLTSLQPGDLIHGIRHDFVVRRVERVNGTEENWSPPPVLHLWSMAGGRARRVSIPGDRFLRDHVKNHRAYYTRPTV